MGLLPRQALCQIRHKVGRDGQGRHAPGHFFRVQLVQGVCGGRVVPEVPGRLPEQDQEGVGKDHGHHRQDPTRHDIAGIMDSQIAPRESHSQS